jgi:hypothetical protein
MSVERKKKVCFSLQEDKVIQNFVLTHGTSSWSMIEQILPSRTGKQCRERWKNVLDPSLSKREWTKEEDLLLQNLFQQHGQKWSRFVEYFQGRSDVLIRNRYQLLMRHQYKEREINHPAITNSEVIPDRELETDVNMYKWIDDLNSPASYFDIFIKC